MSSAKAEAANFPFCTIEPNVGVITIPDERLNILEKLVNPEKVLPTVIEFVDTAGFDSGETFDIGEFDSDTSCCITYNVRLGSTLTYEASIIRSIESIIEFNEPITAQLREVTLNGIPIETPGLLDISCQASVVSPPVVNIGEDVTVSKLMTNNSAFIQTCIMEVEFDVSLINGDSVLDPAIAYSCEYGVYEEYNLKVFDVMELLPNDDNPVVIGVIDDNKSPLLDYRFEDATGKLLSAGLLRIIHNDTILGIDDQVSFLEVGDILDTTFTPVFDGGNVVLNVVAGAIGAGNEFIYRFV